MTELLYVGIESSYWNFMMVQPTRAGLREVVPFGNTAQPAQQTSGKSSEGLEGNNS